MAGCRQTSVEALSVTPTACRDLGLQTASDSAELPIGTVDTVRASGQDSPVVGGYLRHQHPRLADWLESAAHAHRVDRVRLLSEHAAETAAVSDQCVAAEHLDALVGMLDEAAWTIQEAIDHGSATSEDYEFAFRRARAASAWAIAHVDSSLEGSSAAVYEALAALGGSEAAVLTILTAE